MLAEALSIRDLALEKAFQCIMSENDKTVLYSLGMDQFADCDTGAMEIQLVTAAAREHCDTIDSGRNEWAHVTKKSCTVQRHEEHLQGFECNVETAQGSVTGNKDMFTDSEKALKSAVAQRQQKTLL